MLALAANVMGGGGFNPIFARGKMVKKYMEREGNEYFSLSFHILFFPFFPMEKMGKDTFFPWAKMGLDPPPQCNQYTLLQVPSGQRCL